METKVVNIKFGEIYDVYVGRGSKWGNPFTHLKGNTKAEFVVDTREQAIKAYENYILNGYGRHLLKDLYELKGKIIGCYCKPSQCHGDVLARLADELPEVLTVDKILNRNK